MAIKFEGIDPSAANSIVDPYLPSLLALETGALTDPESIAEPLDVPAGDILASGKIPKVHEAGLEKTRYGIVSYDLAAVNPESGGIRIVPTSKQDVDSDDDGRIKAEGDVIMIDLGRRVVRIVATAIDLTRHPMAARNRGGNGLYRPPGGILVVRKSFPDIYEITDVDFRTQSLYAKQRKKYFSIPVTPLPNKIELPKGVLVTNVSR